MNAIEIQKLNEKQAVSEVRTFAVGEHRRPFCVLFVSPPSYTIVYPTSVSLDDIEHDFAEVLASSGLLADRGFHDLHDRVDELLKKYDETTSDVRSKATTLLDSLSASLSGSDLSLNASIVAEISQESDELRRISSMETTQIGQYEKARTGTVALVRFDVVEKEQPFLSFIAKKPTQKQHGREEVAIRLSKSHRCSPELVAWIMRHAQVDIEVPASDVAQMIATAVRG